MVQKSKRHNCKPSLFSMTLKGSQMGFVKILIFFPRLKVRKDTRTLPNAREIIS